MVILKRIALLLSYSAFLSAASDYSTLLNKRYNEVTFPCSHNAQSDKGPNLKTFTSVQGQEKNIEEQLNTGIRGMKIPVFWQDDQVVACHGINHHVIRDVRETVDKNISALHLPSFLRKGIKKIVEFILPKGFGDIYFHPNEVKPCYIDPGMKLFKNVLADVRAFLEQHPTEIVTLFLEAWFKDNNTAPQLLLNVFKETHTDDYLYDQKITGSWPQLKELIDSNKRLIVFIDLSFDQTLYPFNEQGKPAFWSSPYKFDSVKDLKNDAAKKSPDAEWHACPARVWVLQNFVTELTGGNPKAAEEVNTKEVILQRIEKYKNAYNLPNPNFIWVDFFNRPSSNGIFDAIDTLNGVR
jgi:hypothetical protein